MQVGWWNRKEWTSREKQESYGIPTSEASSWTQQENSRVRNKKLTPKKRIAGIWMKWFSQTRTIPSSLWKDKEIRGTLLRVRAATGAIRKWMPPPQRKGRWPSTINQQS